MQWIDIAHVFWKKNLLSLVSLTIHQQNKTKKRDTCRVAQPNTLHRMGKTHEEKGNTQRMRATWFLSHCMTAHVFVKKKSLRSWRIEMEKLWLSIFFCFSRWTWLNKKHKKKICVSTPTYHLFLHATPHFEISCQPKKTHAAATSFQNMKISSNATCCNFESNFFVM